MVLVLHTHATPMFLSHFVPHPYFIMPHLSLILCHAIPSRLSHLAIICHATLIRLATLMCLIYHNIPHLLLPCQAVFPLLHLSSPLVPTCSTPHPSFDSYLLFPLYVCRMQIVVSPPSPAALPVFLQLLPEKKASPSCQSSTMPR